MVIKFFKTFKRTEERVLIQSLDYAWHFLLCKTFQTCIIMVIFLQLWKGAEPKKTKKLRQDEINRELIESLMMSDSIKNEELIKKIQEVEDPEKAAELIQECESIMRTDKKV